VANLTREDAQEFLSLLPSVVIHTTVQPYLLNQANEALEDLRKGKVKGAAVLTM
jgi:propanol-preferring alcohol dehydrogenase